MAYSDIEINELHSQVKNRLEDSLLPALIKANTNESLNDLLRMLMMEDLASDDKSETKQARRIAVIGYPSVNEADLRKIALKHGFEPDDFEFEFKGFKHLNTQKYEYSETYRAVFFGPVGHSMPGKGTSSSLITKMESQPNKYPTVIRMIESNGNLRISGNSFINALKRLLELEELVA